MNLLENIGESVEEIIDLDVTIGIGDDSDSGGEDENSADTNTDTNTGSNNNNNTTDNKGNDAEDSTATDTGSDSNQSNHKQTLFEIIDGLVTAVFVLDNDEIISVPIDTDESYTIDGNDVIHNKSMHFGSQTTRHVDSDEDGSFIRDSELWTVTLDGVENDKPLPVITQLLNFLPTTDNDFLAVREGELTLAGSGADNFVFREAGHLRIGDFNASEGDMLIFDTALGLASKEHLGSLITGVATNEDSMIFSFGDDVSITLTGVTPDTISWDDVSVLS